MSSVRRKNPMRRQSRRSGGESGTVRRSWRDRRQRSRQPRSQCSGAIDVRASAGAAGSRPLAGGGGSTWSSAASATRAVMDAYAGPRERAFATMDEYGRKAPGPDVVARKVVAIARDAHPALRNHVTREATQFTLHLKKGVTFSDPQVQQGSRRQ